MNSEFYEALTLLEKEKDIKKEYMLEKITAAIIAAVKKEKNMDMQPENIASFFDEEKKTVRFFVRKEVVENVENPLTEIDLASAKKINKKYVVGDIASDATLNDVAAAKPSVVASVKSAVERQKRRR